MPVKVDTFSFKSSNNSNLFLCSAEIYIGMTVCGSLFLPLQFFVLWHAMRTMTIKKRLSDVLNLNVTITSVIILMSLFFMLFFFWFSSWFLFFISVVFGVACIQAQAQFQTWICMEQYLAVVHPIFYLKLNFYRYGLALVTFTWVISLVFAILFAFLDLSYGIYAFVTPISGLIIVILMCSVATLATLKQVSPGDGQRREMHLKKVKAFKNITFNLVLFIVRFYPYICITLLWDQMPLKTYCIANSISSSLLYIGSIVHALLYISRYIKIMHCVGVKATFARKE